MSFSHCQHIDIEHSTLNHFRDQHINIAVEHTGLTELVNRWNASKRPFLDLEEMEAITTLRKTSDYRVYSADLRGRVVVVKLFHGPRSKKNWTSTVAFNKRLMHPNILHPLGTSSPDSDTQFIVFSGGSDISVEKVLAFALATDLTQSVALGLKMISSLSSGLHYLSDCGIPLSLIGINNFDIIFGNREKILISVHPTLIENYLTPEFIQTQDYTFSRQEEWNVLDELCRKTFRAVNRVLYREQVDRNRQDISSPVDSQPASILDLRALPAGTLDSIESSSSLNNQRCRREFVWKSTTSMSLEEISEQYDEFIDVPVFSVHASRPLPRIPRLRSRFLPQVQTPHRCQGYNREEIILTVDISQNAIISHSMPSLREICSVCGEVVKEADVFRCVCGKRDDPLRSNIRCTRCSVWQHRDCIIVPTMGASYFLCEQCTQTRNAIASSSDVQTETSQTSNTEDLPTNVLFYVKALYPYQATIAEEFDFEVGDIIAVTATPDDGWWSGQLLDSSRQQKGRYIFPSNFVSLF